MPELSDQTRARALEIFADIEETFYGPAVPTEGAAAWPLACIIATLEERVSKLENQ